MAIEVDLNEVESLAAKGLTNEQIYLSLGISETTHYEWKKNKPAYAEAIKRGQSRGIKDISNSLYDSAMNGNVTAQIFFLKNRSPETWADKQEHEHKGGVDIRWIQGE